MTKRRWFWAAIAAICLIAVARIAGTYGVLCETVDEPIHIAAGFELLSRGVYEIDVEHPPLARAAFALASVVAHVPAPTETNAIAQAHQILFSRGEPHYLASLAAARAGNLPFFLLAVLVVAAWSRRLYGDTEGVLAALIFTLIPPLLGHAGLATTDMAAVATTSAALYSLSRWLEARQWRWALVTSLAIGGGLACKFSFVPFFAGGAGVLVLLRIRRGEGGVWKGSGRAVALQCAVGVAIVFIVVWAAYGFATGPLDRVKSPLLAVDPNYAVAERYERVPGYAWVRPDLINAYWDYARSPAAQGRRIDFVDWARAAGYPSPLAGRHGDTMAGLRLPPRRLSDRLLESFRAGWHRHLGRSVPAPQFVVGMAAVAAHNRFGHASFLLGRYGNGGWWYYFPVVFFFKTPLPFLLFCCAGLFTLSGRERLALIAVPAAMLAIAMGSAINIGLRHILPLYPFLSIIAAAGLVALWRRQRAIAAVLLAWLVVGSVWSHPDYIAYFNEAAGRHPERIAVDSNLDWGQDLLRLRAEMRKRHIERIHLAYFGNAYPPFFGMSTESLQAGVRTSGFVAVSETERVMKDRGAAYRWLDAYQPLARIGKSIRLYDVPP